MDRCHVLVRLRRHHREALAPPYPADQYDVLPRNAELVLALDGLAPRKRRKRAPAVKTPAAEHPIAQVVLDIQATHLGQTFDYFVEEKYSAAAQPGVMVRVRFGGQRVNGIIWKRADTSATPESSIRYIERVVTDRVLVPESMRDDMTRIADAFGGTRANILRLAVPPRVAKVESQLRVGNRDAAGTAAGKQRLAAVDQEIYGQLQRQYGNINLLHDALQGRRFQSFVFDLLPGADHWRRCAAWMVAAALAQNKPAVLVLPACGGAEALEGWVRTLLEVRAQLGRSAEITVVDCGLTAEGARRVQLLAQRFDKIMVLDRDELDRIIE